MSRLEERYRRVLRLLPGPYLRDWEDDMVAAFLASQATDDQDAADYVADYGRPSVPEIASVVSLAIRLRLGGTDAPPHSFAWGQAVRLAALSVMLTHAVLATSGVAVEVWLAGKVAWLPAPPAEWATTTPTGLWRTAWGFAGYAWLPAFIALVLGHRRAAQAAAVLAIGPAVVSTVVGQAMGDQPLSLTPWMAQLFDILLVCALAAFHGGAPPVRRGLWFSALAAGMVVVPVPLVLVQVTTPAAGWLDWPALASAFVTAAVVVHLASRMIGRARPTTPWPLALTLLAVATFGLRLSTLPGYRHQVHHTTLLAVGLAELVVVSAVAVPVAVLAVRDLRRLRLAATGIPEPTTRAG